MKSRQWVNREHPQTLVLATVLLYIEGLFNLVRGPIAVIVGLGMIVAGFRIANNKRWGWRFGVITAALSILLRLTWSTLSFGMLLSLLFPIALFALLVHPLTRNYQNFWFE